MFDDRGGLHPGGIVLSVAISLGGFTLGPLKLKAIFGK